MAIKAEWANNTLNDDSSTIVTIRVIDDTLAADEQIIETFTRKFANLQEACAAGAIQAIVDAKYDGIEMVAEDGTII